MNEIAIIVSIIMGLVVGSFLNVVIYRLPVMLENDWAIGAKEILQKPIQKVLSWLPQDKINEAKHLLCLPDHPEPKFNLITPHSRCGNCGSAVRPWQNIPIISWLLLRGRCHNCHTPISIRYPLVELLTGILFALVAWQYGWTTISIWGCILTGFIVALMFIDADTQLLPDQLTIPLIWLGLLFNLHTDFISLTQSILGAIVGYMSLWLLFQTYKLCTGKDGMGYGDFKMLAAIGAWVGVSMLPIVVLTASLIGIAAALIQRVGKGQPMAFGPSLAIAGWFVFILHTQSGTALAWWLTKSGF